MSVLHQYRFVLVVALLAIAVALLTGRNRLPLAFQGIVRALGGTPPPVDRPPVSRWRRLAAFALVVLAFLLAVMGGRA